MQAASFLSRCLRVSYRWASRAVGAVSTTVDHLGVLPMTNAALLKTKHVIVVGAGIGGLVSAMLLAHSGVRVTLVESAGAPGGKMRRVMAGGAPVDSGPTVFTMRWVFEQIFAQVGCHLADVVKLEPLDPRLDTCSDAGGYAVEKFGLGLGRQHQRRGGNFIGGCVHNIANESAV